mmetsp:Transcript_38815/g.94234  ORF Transcript_38815/g.94234 Transcript_38815/m.94234 type:complete len:126 (-) Transcript_38815:386-763(-)
MEALLTVPGVACVGILELPSRLPEPPLLPRVMRSGGGRAADVRMCSGRGMELAGSVAAFAASLAAGGSRVLRQPGSAALAASLPVVEGTALFVLIVDPRWSGGKTLGCAARAMQCSRGSADARRR